MELMQELDVFTAKWRRKVSEVSLEAICLKVCARYKVQYRIFHRIEFGNVAELQTTGYKEC